MNAPAVTWARTQTLFARILIALATLAVAITGFAPAAQAAAAPVSAGVHVSQAANVRIATAGGICDVGGSNAKAGTGTSTELVGKLLPMNRWSESTTEMHQLMLSQDHISNALNGIQRQTIVANGLGFGNGLWQVTGGMTTMAVSMCPLNEVGGAMDSVVGMLGDAIMGSPILALIAVALIAAVAFSFMRRGGGGQSKANIISKLAALGVLAAMVFGAQASTGGGAFSGNSDAPYKPGIMSPGWIVTTMNKTIGNVASAPAAALTIGDSFDMDQSTWNSNLSCSTYTAVMKDSYRSFYGNGLDQMSAGLPLTLTNLWEGSAMQAWRTAQFGNGLNALNNENLKHLPLDDSVWCRMLDWNADVPRTTAEPGGARVSTEKIMETAMAVGTDKNIIQLPKGAIGSNAFNPVGAEAYDRSAIAWATCDLHQGSSGASESTWVVDWRFDDRDLAPAREKRNPGESYVGVDPVEASPEACKNWFTDSDDKGDKFKWATTNHEVADRAEGNEPVQTFVNTLHGTDNSASTPAMVAYAIASVVILFSFGLMAIGLVFAKAVMAITIIGVFISIVMVLFPGGSWSKVGGVLKVLLGVMIFAWCIQFLMSLVAFLTSVLVGFGDSFLEDGSTFDIFWTGLAPAVAVLILHLLFTKVLKIASPFSITGAMSWGKKIGGAGASAMSGLGSMASAGNYLRNRAERGRGGGSRNGVDGDGPNGNTIVAGGGDGVIGAGVGSPTTRRGQANPMESNPAGRVPDGVQGGGGTGSDSGVGSGRSGSSDDGGELVGAGVGGGRKHTTDLNSGLAATAAALANGGGPSAAPLDRGGDTLDGADIESVEGEGGVDPVAASVGETDDGDGQEQGQEQVPESPADEFGKNYQGFDPDMLTMSKIANSKMGKGGMSMVGDGRMSAGERTALKQTAKAERGLATEWDNNRREAMGLKPRSDNKAVRFWEHRMANLRNSAHNARRNFAANPAGSIFSGAKSAQKHMVKGAVIGAGALTVASFAPAMAPLVLAGLAGRQFYKLRRKDQKVDKRQMDQVVSDYRAQRSKEVHQDWKNRRMHNPKSPAQGGQPATGPQQPTSGAAPRIGPTGPGSAPVIGAPAAPAPGGSDYGRKNTAWHNLTNGGPTVNQDILNASSVPNSQLGKGKNSQFGNRQATHWERAKVNVAAHQERRKAVAYENQRRAQRGQAPMTTGTTREALQGTLSRAGSSVRQTGSDFKNKDFNSIFNRGAAATGTLAKGGAVGAGAVAATALMGPAGLPVLAAGAGVAGVVRSRRKLQAERAPEMDRVVDQFRQANRASATKPEPAATTDQLPVVPPRPQHQPGRPAGPQPRPGGGQPSEFQQAQQAGKAGADPDRIVTVGDYTNMSTEQARAKAISDGLNPDIGDRR